MFLRKRAFLNQFGSKTNWFKTITEFSH